MPNPHKIALLTQLRDRFGQLRKLPGSESLFQMGDDAARLYVRYSRVHGDGRMFFEDFQAAVNRRPAHLLGAFGRSVNVAMMAGLIAQARDVDLQSLDADWREIEVAPCECFFEGR